MSDYVNGLQIHLNELVLMDFIENRQGGANIMTSVWMTYETLIMMHGAIAQAIERRDEMMTEAKASMN